MTKLPPRLAKVREQQKKEEKQNTGNINSFMTNIENWDNELASNIPPPASANISEPVKPKSTRK